MLSFLRKMRKNSKQRSTYFAYALGEIILVVVGILIALAINNWNEQRKETNNEQILLEKLSVEHDYNLGLLYSDTSYMNNIDESISQVYFNLKEPDEESDSIIAENINSVLRVSLLEFSTEYLDRYINNSKLTNDDLVTEFIELKELFASLEISGRLIYDYKVDKVISWLEESLDFYDAEISDIERLRDMVFVNRLIILESIEIGRLENFEESLQKAVVVDSLLKAKIKK
jgi:hypothetical protein